MSKKVVEMAVDLTEKERKIAAKEFPGAHEFVHLHNHTLFSPLDGIATPEEYFSAAAYLGQPAFSITDHGSMANVPDAYWAALRNKVKFIPGCEIYFNPHHQEFIERRDTEEGFSINKLKETDFDSWLNYRTNRHLSVLAMNMTGYQNLIRMTTEAWEIGFYYKPRIWFEQIEKYHEGLIILSGCLNGPVCHHLRRSAFFKNLSEGMEVTDKKGNVISMEPSEARKHQAEHMQTAIEWVKRFRDLLGDRYYMELQMPGEEIPFGKEAFRQVSVIAEKFNIPAVITNDCHYLKRKDFKVQKCMMAIDQGLTINDPNLFHVNSDEQFFKSRAQLRKTFYEGQYDKFISPEKFEEYCDNTVKLAERCDNFDPNLDPKLPKIPDAAEKLTKLVMESLTKRGLMNDKRKFNIDGQMVTYKEQALIELKRFISKGFASYFLIIRDLVQFSKGHGWDIGPGRGSAGGSLVCYLLDIHSLDPMLWGLSSVRFMGDARGGDLLEVSMD